MNYEKICLGECRECGQVIRGTESFSRIGGEKYHRYCWITQKTIANA